MRREVRSALRIATRNARDGSTRTRRKQLLPSRANQYAALLCRPKLLATDKERRPEAS